jgi:hypothetical protein
VSGRRVPGGVVHKLPADLRKALIANATALDAWKDITPLARNEYIYWVEDAKQERTREPSGCLLLLEWGTASGPQRASARRDGRDPDRDAGSRGRVLDNSIRHFARTPRANVRADPEDVSILDGGTIDSVPSSSRNG